MCDLHARAETAFCAKGEMPSTSRAQITATRVLLRKMFEGLFLSEWVVLVAESDASPEFCVMETFVSFSFLANSMRRFDERAHVFKLRDKSLHRNVPHNCSEQCFESFHNSYFGMWNVLWRESTPHLWRNVIFMCLCSQEFNSEK